MYKDKAVDDIKYTNNISDSTGHQQYTCAIVNTKVFALT